MKTMISHKISLLLLAVFFILPISLWSQEIKLSRQDKKEARKAMLAENYRILDSLITGRKFVLEADFLQNQMGDRIAVASRINFIKINGESGILQTGNDFRTGYNGVGGVTAEGIVSSWKVTRDKRSLTHKVSFNIQTKLGTYNVFLTVNPENRATAEISGSRSGRLTWDGHLLTIDNSKVFKGMETF
ncbi:MAG TPA: DUF4251 domain-containing protein [Bacteroidales bacterium]|nr:DUF4251 domain-containing protein [Bacteroidales bacterium]HNR42986.1 DUF4251 domain-containing protein [Bacteroidales bacterium]HQG78553.1 DUF4251 domain-containing protein [Bacteroidales bacterium]